jgi:predicted RND superfamily exporter protein
MRRTRREVMNKHLYEARSRFLESDYLAEDPDSGEELWRIHVRVAALKGVDYGEFIQQIKAKVEPLLNANVDAETKAARGYGLVGVNGAIYTGLTPVVYKAESALLRGLVESFFTAFAMMAVIMTIVFRDVRAGLYTMLPNAWPVAVVFGLMSWLGIALDIGTMMTAGVAMGVCVDDTVHFANWFRRATRMGLPRREAVVMAYENSAGAIYQSTVIVALGLASFGLSNFMPTQRFGILMGTLLTFGLIADLVLTPAMLSGAIGRYFLKGCQPKIETQTANIDELLTAGMRIDQPAKVIVGPTVNTTQRAKNS